MEITFLEDPACYWCWAFQPVSTAFAFEFRDVIQSQVKVRCVMGGLRNRPVADVDFIMYQWKRAEAVSGMPFDCSVWKKHPLKTTYLACRAVKAAELMEPSAGDRMLRRLREAFYAEQTPIDDTENILRLAAEVNLAIEPMGEHLANGRAEALFERDRMEASEYGFGFPTIIIRDKHHEHPVLLRGAVPYRDLMDALFAMGISPAQRQRFRDAREDWERLFAVHPRLTLTEIRLVCGMEKTKLLLRLAEIGAVREGCFYRIASPGKEATERVRPERRKGGCETGTFPGAIPRQPALEGDGPAKSSSGAIPPGTNGIAPVSSLQDPSSRGAHGELSSPPSETSGA